MTEPLRRGRPQAPQLRGFSPREQLDEFERVSSALVTDQSHCWNEKLLPALDAAEGRPARIVAKMNALLDPDMIAALYEASQAGVQVDLIVRGICALRPGLPGVSDRIRVTSIVGRYLEHSRIFSFENGGHPEVWLGSADLIPRNLRARVEILFPIDDPALKQRLRDEVLALYLADRVKARDLNGAGTYVRRAPAARELPNLCSVTPAGRA